MNCFRGEKSQVYRVFLGVLSPGARAYQMYVAEDLRALGPVALA